MRLALLFENDELADILRDKVLKLSKQGLTNREITDKLQIPPRQVGAYIRWTKYSPEEREQTIQKRKDTISKFTPERREEIAQQKRDTILQKNAFADSTQHKLLDLAASIWKVVKFYSRKIQALQPDARKQEVADIVRTVASKRNIPPVFHEMLVSIVIEKAVNEHMF